MINRISLFVLFVFTCFSYVSAQDCYTPELTPLQEELLRNLSNNTSTSGRTTDIEPVTIAVTAHLIGKNNGSGTLTDAQIKAAFDRANAAFSDIGIMLIVSDYNRINDASFFNFTDTQEEELRATYYRPNTINIYFVNTVSMASVGSSLCGYAHLPGGPDLIVMKNSCTTSGKSLEHELGHFLGLEHTFETKYGVELVVRSGESSNGTQPANCDVAGDLVCDTPADLQSIQGNLNSLCEYTGTEKDANGDLYDPDTKNIMSYRSNTCRSRFTPGQYERMHMAHTEIRNYFLEGTAILDFELAEQALPSLIDQKNHTILVIIKRGTDLTDLQPTITMAPELAISPARDASIDLTSPVTYTVTAPDGTTQDWIVTGEITKSFDTQWEVSSGDSIGIPMNNNFEYNFEYAWLAGDDTIKSGIHTTDDGELLFTATANGTYTLKILGEFPYFGGYPIDKLIDVTQWGHTFWQSMDGTFEDWPGVAFSAPDAPVLKFTTSMGSMFKDARNFNQDLSKWDVSNVTNMSDMFLNASAFNGNISTWDVGQVNNMYNMFKGASAFNQDITNWDVGNVTNMRAMFNGAEAFNQDIGLWNVGRVKNMQGFFIDAKAFNADISSWDVRAVKNLSYMFRRATAFNQDISSWDTQSAESFEGLFENAAAFDQDLSNWDVSSVTSMKFMFTGSGLSPQNYDQLLIGWATQDVKDDVQLDAEGISYCKGASARESLITDHGWSFFDGDRTCLSETDVLAFELDGQTDEAVINTTDHTISFSITSETDVTAIAPVITLSPGASSDPASGEIIDFSSLKVVYTVTAEDGTTTQDWTVQAFVEKQVLRLEKETSIKVYPNPVYSELHIENKQEVGVYITDITGRQLSPIQSGKNLSLNLGNLLKGTYLLIIQEGEKVTSHKIIKK